MNKIHSYKMFCFDYDENDRVRNIFNSVYELGAIPIINKPIRVTQTSVTVIDNILTNDVTNTSLNKGIIRNDRSDYFPVFFSINSSKQQRDFTNKNIDSFKEQISFLNWKNIDFNEDAHNR